MKTQTQHQPALGQLHVLEIYASTRSCQIQAVLMMHSGQVANGLNCETTVQPMLTSADGKSSTAGARRSILTQIPSLAISLPMPQLGPSVQVSLLSLLEMATTTSISPTPV
ncbi:MAG: hypothetical protein CMA65_06570 [Euryarchaeota archaeon]|nr:hypothetical protein [Euryarchaeota archaeon]